MRPTVTRLLLGVLLVGLGLSACGGGDRPAEEGARRGGAGGAVAFPATVPGRFGTAEVPRAPRRVVALDTPSADAALAVGVVPVAIAEVPNRPDGLEPWTAAALRRLGVRERPARLAGQPGTSVEAVAAQRPDVVLAVGTFNAGDLYDRLSRLAPTVTYAGQEPLDDTWESAAVRVGQALGREGAARREVGSVRGAVRDTARGAGLRGRTIALFNFVDVPYLVWEPADAAVRYFAAFGMRPPAAARTLPRRTGQRTEVSAERLDILDADVVAGTSPDPTSLARFVRRPAFAGLRAAREGRYVALEQPQAVSLAFPSALSVRWSLAEVVPRLRATARGEGG